MDPNFNINYLPYRACDYNTVQPDFGLFFKTRAWLQTAPFALTAVFGLILNVLGYVVEANRQTLVLSVVLVAILQQMIEHRGRNLQKQLGRLKEFYGATPTVDWRLSYQLNVFRQILSAVAVLAGTYYLKVLGLDNYPLVLCLTYLGLIIAQHLLTILPWEMVLYVVFGGLTTLVSLVSFSIFDWLINRTNSLPFDWSLPKILAFIMAIIFAYATNRRFVFQSHNKIWPECLRFLLSRLFSFLIIEVLGFIILCDLLHMNKQVVNLEIALVVLIANYLLSKMAVFKQPK